jgi:hypothetical protein
VFIGWPYEKSPDQPLVVPAGQQRKRACSRRFRFRLYAKSPHLAFGQSQHVR